jgi:predicted kinase
MAAITDKGFTEQRFDYSDGRPDAPELVMMVGVSGSGKSVHAKALVNRGRGGIVRLNRDSIRAMLYCDVPWNSKNENLVRNWQMEGARQALQAGKDAIIDDTNCVRNTRQKWEEFAQQARVRFRVITMTTPLDVCIERDARREGRERVGEGVIRKQHKDLTALHISGKEPKEAKLTRPYFERQALKDGGWTVRLPDAPWVLVDVDGTLATFVNPETGEKLRGPFEEHRVLVDLPVETVCEWVRSLFPHYNICIVSGRHDFCGDDTCDWLETHGVPFDHILMRRSGDNRSDAPVKEEILRELQAAVGGDHGAYTRWEEFSDGDGKPILAVPKCGIAFVIDDRPRVVRMWRSMGVPAFPVRGWVVHAPGCAYDGQRGYRQCPDCGALEDF